MKAAMVINSIDGKFQASYWRDAARIADAPDSVEYSDFLMELKDRTQKLLRRGDFAYAAIFRWDAQAESWELVGEFALRTGPATPDRPEGAG
jgi:hypothetical protein